MRIWEYILEACIPILVQYCTPKSRNLKSNSQQEKHCGQLDLDARLEYNRRLYSLPPVDPEVPALLKACSVLLLYLNWRWIITKKKNVTRTATASRQITTARCNWWPGLAFTRYPPNAPGAPPPREINIVLGFLGLVRILNSICLSFQRLPFLS